MTMMDSVPNLAQDVLQSITNKVSTKLAAVIPRRTIDLAGWMYELINFAKVVGQH